LNDAALIRELVGALDELVAWDDHPDRYNKDQSAKWIALMQAMNGARRALRLATEAGRR